MDTSVYYRLYQYLLNGTANYLGEPNFQAMMIDGIITIAIVSLIYFIFRGFRIRKRSDLIIISSLFIFSFLLRMVFLNNGFLHHDSVQLANAVNRTLESGHLYFTQGGRYGLVVINLIFYALLKHFASQDFILNFVTALFGSGAIPLLFVFGKEVMDKRGALYASILFSLCPIYFIQTTFATNHGVSVFFALLSAYLLVKGIRTQSWIYKIFFGIVFGISLTIRITNIFYLIPFVLLYFTNIIQKRYKFHRTDLLYLIFLLPLILLMIFDENLYINLSVMPTGIQSSVSNALMHFINSITIIGLVLMIFGITMLVVKKDYKIVIFYGAWLIIPFIYFGSLTFSVPRYFIPVLIPAILLISYGIISLERYSTIAFLSIAVLMAVIVYPIVDFRHDYCGPKEAALFYKDMTDKASVIISNDYGVFYEYYGDRKSMGFPIHGDVSALQQTLTDMLYLLDNNIELYTTKTMFGAYEMYGDDKFARALGNNFDLEIAGKVKTEDYHYAEQGFYLFEEEYIRISKKENLSDVKVPN